MHHEEFTTLSRKRDDLIFQAHQIDRQIKAAEEAAKKERENRAHYVLNLLARHRLTINDLETIITKNQESK